MCLRQYIKQETFWKYLYLNTDRHDGYGYEDRKKLTAATNLKWKEKKKEEEQNNEKMMKNKLYKKVGQNLNMKKCVFGVCLLCAIYGKWEKRIATNVRH